MCTPFEVRDIELSGGPDERNPGATRETMAEDSYCNAARKPEGLGFRVLGLGFRV